MSDPASDFPEMPRLTPAEFDNYGFDVQERVCEPFETSMDASGMPIEGLALAALPSIALSERQTLPFVWVYVQHALRMWEVSTILNARLIVSDVLKGQVHTLALRMPKGKRWSPAMLGSKRGPRPEGQALSGGTCSADPGELNALYGELTPGRYALTATVYDWKSNTVVVEVSQRPGPLELPAPVPLEVARERTTQLEQLVHSGQVEFAQAASNAPALEGRGLAVRVASNQTGKPMVLGRLRVLPEEGAHVVAHGDKGLADGFAWVTFILAELDELDAETKAVQIPLEAEGDSLLGQFAVNLDALVGAETKGRLLYVVAGRYVEGAFSL